MVEETVAFVQPAQALETAAHRPARFAGLTASRAFRWRVAAGLVIAGSALFHLWYIGAGFLDLAPDEAHYWEWSRRLDWSYYSKGPVVAYLIAASTRLGGHTEFWVRLPAVILAAASGMLAYALALRLFHNERVALLTVLIYLACPLFAAGSALMTTDAPLMFFWILATFALVRAVDPEVRRAWAWWLLCGAAVGFGWLSKYTMAFFFVGCLTYLAYSRTARTWLAKPSPYVALLVSVVMFVPVVVWNAQHDWLSLRHVIELAGLGAAVPTPPRPLAGLLEFVGAALGVVSPLLLCAVVVALRRSTLLGLREHDDRHLLLASFSCPMLAFFLLWSMVGDVEANWPAPAYVTAFVATAAWWNTLLQQAAPAARRRLRNWIVCILMPGLATSIVAHFSGLLPLAGIYVPSRLDPADRLRGWNELGRRVGQLLSASPPVITGRDQEGGTAGGTVPFLMASSYHIASELAFYTPGQPRVYEINLGRRMSQYDIWNGLDERRGDNAVFVTYGDWPAEAFSIICTQPRRLDLVRVVRNGRAIETFSVYACDGFKGAPNFGTAPTH